MRLNKQMVDRFATLGEVALSRGLKRVSDGTNIACGDLFYVYYDEAMGLA